MQNKGAIKAFAIIFALVCLYQLSFTWVSSNVEKQAKEFAAGDENIERAYLDSMLSVGVYNIGIKNYTYQEVRDREINLGLDLQGGMNVTLEVSVAELIKNMSNNSKNPVFVKAYNETLIEKRNSQEDFVTIFGRNFKKADPEAKLSSPDIFGTRELKGKVEPFQSTNDEVLEFLKTESSDAIDRSFNVLRTRIDKFGVAQPNIQKLGNTGRILVELPGVKDKDRVRNLLQGTAKLEFWETLENQTVYPYLEKANEELKKILELEAAENSPADGSEIEVVEEKTLEEVAETVEDTATNDLISQIGSETDSLKVDGADQNSEDFAKNYPLFAVLRPAIFQDGGQYYPGQGPVVGYASVSDTAKVNKYLAMKRVRAALPNKSKFLWTVKPDGEGRFLQLVAISVTDRDGKAPLGGDVIVDARQEFGQMGGQSEVNMTMNADGAKRWKKLTADNIGKSIAIVLDDYVYSFPTVRSEISGGSSSISGNFTINEAKDLANILKAGKLPAPASIVEEAVVGPSLGAESIRSGIISFVLALVLVLIFMVFWYSYAGIAANLALAANIFFIMGVLASLGAVLTLPGIAGIVLIIGMTVDANVLIFERIREELRAGKGLALAIKDGYNNAYSSIIDANVTSLLTGIILYVFGTGPIRGFATTLVIGILTSLFAAIFITRLVFESRLVAKKAISFSNEMTSNVFNNFNFDFIGMKKKTFLISGIVILIGIGSIITRGLNYGIDFTGGRTFVVRFEASQNSSEIRTALVSAFGEAPEVKTFGPNNQLKITTKYLIDSEDKNASNIVEEKLTEGLNASNAGNFEILSSQIVGPTVAEDIKASAVWSILFSLMVIFLYIVLRFRAWQFGLGAIAAIFHDVLIILSIFSIFNGILPFSLEIDQAFIAAILTVVGYSINDTVVVFDRLREYITGGSKKSRKDLINIALNSTISRTFNTSLTTLIVLTAIFIFGGEVIRGFTFALLVGVIVGTYSSLFVATPIYFDLSEKQVDKA
jgi:SecD/SecF fusion protein